MNRLWPVFFASCLLALGGCKRGVCEIGESGFDSMSPEWKAHEDLVPPGAKVCGHFKPVPGVKVDMAKVLHIDFEDDPNPWVTIVDHLEKQGYKRTTQSIDSPDHQSAFLRKGKDRVHVITKREKGRFRAVLELQD